MAKKTDEQVQKELIALKLKNDERHHEMRMEGLAYMRESDQIHHDHEMERQRIKSAEIRKAFERRQSSQYPHG